MASEPTSYLEQLKLIDSIKSDLKKDPVVQKMFEEYKVDINEIDYIPICFAELDVSARTDHCIIYLNKDLLDEPKEIPHYCTHEITHFLQQSTGDGPTKGSTDDTYLKNPAEIEGFQNQSEFISETEGDEEAERYISKVLDHHGEEGKEREKRKKELLQLNKKVQAAKVIDFNKFKEEKEKQPTKDPLLLLFELMDPNVVANSFPLTIDDMYAARKAAGFPKIPDGSPTWLYLILGAIDTEDPAKRKAKTTRLNHWWARASKDETQKAVAEEEYKKEYEEDKKRFCTDAKRGWLRFSEINKWSDNYPLLFSDIEWLIKEKTDDALAYLKKKQKFEADIQRENAHPSAEPSSFPVGTKLFLDDDYKHIYHFDWTVKTEPDYWVNNNNFSGNDIFIKRRLDSKILMTKPDSYFKQLIDKEPTIEQANEVIQNYLKTDPEKFLKGLWQYDLWDQYYPEDKNEIKFSSRKQELLQLVKKQYYINKIAKNKIHPIMQFGLTDIVSAKNLPVGTVLYFASKLYGKEGLNQDKVIKIAPNLWEARNLNDQAYASGNDDYVNRLRVRNTADPDSLRAYINMTEEEARSLVSIM